MSNRPRPNEHSDAAKPDTPDKYRNDKARWKEPVPPDATPEGRPPVGGRPYSRALT